MKKPTEKALYNYIVKLLENEFNVEPELINKDARLVEDLGLDSIDIVDFIMYANDKYKVEIPRDVDKCFYHCHTIQDLISVLMPVFDGDISKIPKNLKPPKELCPDSELWAKNPN